MHTLSRRQLLGGASGLLVPAMVPAMTAVRPARASQTLSFGLTPVFLTSDLRLLESLQSYLAAATGQGVRLVLKRTYQEITSQLLAGQLDAAWICGFPFVAYRPRLALLAVPTWRKRNSYQAYLIARKGRQAMRLEDLAGDIHAFSDPDSNSGFLVTRALLAERSRRPEGFFSRSFFTFGHRNVIRAVAAGLAHSGSVDGYVWEVMTETEPELAARTEIVRRSEWMGFPPIATSRALAGQPQIERLRRALLDMPADPVGRHVLDLLRLDGFATPDPSLFDSIAERLDLVRRAG